MVLTATLLAVFLWAQDSSKLSFVIGGSEKTYNQIRVENETSQENFHCRVVVLNDDNSIREVYGEYQLGERNDSDSKTQWINRGTKVGVQMPKDFPGEVKISVEYRDYPLFDAIVIHLTDAEGGYDDTF